MIELKNVFKIAKESKLDIYVAVTIPGQEDCEYIVNKSCFSDIPITVPLHGE